jgi:hypothetical protein
MTHVRCATQAFGVPCPDVPGEVRVFPAVGPHHFDGDRRLPEASVGEPTRGVDPVPHTDAGQLTSYDLQHQADEFQTFVCCLADALGPCNRRC